MTYYRLLPLVALLALLASPAALANPLFLPERGDAPAAEPVEAPATIVLADIAPPDTPRPVPNVPPDTPRPVSDPATTTLDVAPDLPVVNASNRIFWLAGGGVGAVLLGAWLLVRGRRREVEDDA